MKKKTKKKTKSLAKLVVMADDELYDFVEKLRQKFPTLEIEYGGSIAHNAFEVATNDKVKKKFRGIPNRIYLDKRCDTCKRQIFKGDKE